MDGIDFIEGWTMLLASSEEDNYVTQYLGMLVPSLYPTLEGFYSHIINHVGTFTKKEQEEIASVVKLVSTLLLYIRGHADIVKQVHPGSKNKPPRTETGRRNASPSVYNVGDRYAYIIEHWEDENVKHPKGGDPTGREVRPHFRRPHPHLYHTKDGPVIHFLGPICVKGALWDEYDPNAPTKILVR
jgi:hypothetical protein